ncbi:MAG: hypothetical protein ACLFM7_03045 [Bacteroidales bacterium]
MKPFTKSLLFIISGILVFSFSLNAQEKDERDTEEIVKSQRIAFFTEKIGLTTEEAKRFWPVYNGYWKEKNEIISAWKQRFKEYRQHPEELSEPQTEKLADDYVEFEMSKAELLQEYHKKFKEILPIRKVMKIYQADYEFKAYLLEKIRNSSTRDNE